MILLVLGVVMAAAGAALIGFGIPIDELSRGTTMILAGTSVLVGGLILIGLSALIAETARVAALLRMSQAARPTRAAIEAAPATDTLAREQLSSSVEPQPAAAASPSLEVSTSAIERLRSSIPRADRPVAEAEDVPLSPNGQQLHARELKIEPPFRAEPMPQAESALRGEPIPRVEPAPRSAGAAAVEAREPRLDFLFRPRQARPSPQPQQSFDTLWPKRAERDAQSEPKIEVSGGSEAAQPAAPPVSEASSTASSEAAPPPASPRPERHEAPPPQEERAVAILKSGVVDGMAYTLYADGSIEAQLPQGMVRFGSIAELRAHIESHS